MCNNPYNSLYSGQPGWGSTGSSFPMVHSICLICLLIHLYLLILPVIWTWTYFETFLVNFFTTDLRIMLYFYAVYDCILLHWLLNGISWGLRRIVAYVVVLADWREAVRFVHDCVLFFVDGTVVIGLRWPVCVCMSVTRGQLLDTWTEIIHHTDRLWRLWWHRSRVSCALRWQCRHVFTSSRLL